MLKAVASLDSCLYIVLAHKTRPKTLVSWPEYCSGVGAQWQCVAPKQHPGTGVKDLATT